MTNLALLGRRRQSSRSKCGAIGTFVLLIQSVVRLAIGVVIVLVAVGAVGIATAILSSSLALLVSVG